jgi:polysaccharide deacetylase 2 family uncharacterized protein YibQ
VATVLVAVYVLSPVLWPTSPEPAPRPRKVRKPRRAYRPPLYEVRRATRRSRQLGRLEVSLYQALRGAGAADDDIIYQLGAAGDRAPAIVLVRIKPHPGPAAFARRFVKRLDRRGAKVKLLVRKTGRVEAVISLHGRPTHRLVIRPRAGRRAVRARPVSPKAGRAPAASPVRTPARGKKPRVAIIIDDIGHLKRLGRQLIDLDLPLAMSVLPYTRHGAQLARLAHARGKVVMVHLPLEPLARWRADPGPGALKVKMKRAELVRLTRAALARVPFAVGVNNHMGSRFTRDREKMRIVLAELKKKGLFFVDSWTTGRSVAFGLARQMCLRSAIRTVFLDNNLDVRYISLQVIKLVSEARRRGQAVGIGHPHQSTYAVLKAYAAYLRRNVDLVPITALVRRRKGCPAQRKQK